ncbi:TPA: hypothetical protein NJZ52_004458 [Vibrio parahaemolyticus]|nr:hypothetical protein [Vibrio parahaemolyticus]
MKIQPYIPSIFPEHHGELIKSFELFSEGLSEKFDVPKEIFRNHYGVFELTLALTQDSRVIEDHFDMICNFTAELINKNVGIELISKSIEHLDEGIAAFNSMKNSAIVARDDYSFKENVDSVFDSINKIIEHMIKKEGSFITHQELINDNQTVSNNYSLFTVIDNCEKFLLKSRLCSVNHKKIFNVPVNQWRNISAHRDYECKNHRIYLEYGRGERKKLEISIEDLDRVLTEVYRMRVNIKFVTGIVLSILSSKYLPHDFKKVGTPLKNLLSDFNYYLINEGVSILKFLKVERFIINEIEYENKENKKLYEIEFGASKDFNSDELAVKWKGIATAISLAFSDYNNLPNREEVVFHIYSTSFEPKFNMIISFD